MYDLETIKAINARGSTNHENPMDVAGALRWLLDDLTDAGENRANGAAVEFDSVANARTVLARIGR